MVRSTETLPTEQILWQRACVASLLGNCEAIAASGLLSEPAEESLRLLIAKTLGAFGMQAHDERNAA